MIETNHKLVQGIRGEKPAKVFYRTEQEKPKKNHWVITLLAVIGLLLVVFVIKPGLEGYGIYKQVQKTNYSLEEYAENIHGLKLELSTIKNNLTVYSSFASQLQQEVTSTSQQLTTCVGEKAALQVEVDKSNELCKRSNDLLEQQFSEKIKENEKLIAEKTKAAEDSSKQCSNSLSQTKTELDSLKLSYDALVKNSARSICCKQKVDDPRITSYTVVDSRIYCLEQGSSVLDCG